MEITIEGAEVYLPGEIAQTNVTIAEGRIAEIGGAARGEIVDGRGLILAPGLVDLHGDAFERQIMPRPGVFFPMEMAVLETDRQLAANGITTAYHALTLSWEPGLRSVAEGARMLEAMGAAAARLTVENRVQLRWETFCFEALELIEQALSGPLLPAIAFNDHTSMGVLDKSVPLQTRPFDLDPDFPVRDLHSPAFVAHHAGRAKRAKMEPEAFAQLMRDRWARRDEVPAAIERVAEMGRAAGAPMLSHDDSRAESRAFYRERGARVSEFPMCLEAAEAARANGDFIAFGAPNATRGGSHIGSLGAGDMVEAGLCDALASDYFYPAMLAAVDRLDQEKRADRLALWRLISSGPARAMQLEDRGEIAAGKRADLVLVDWPETRAPAVLRSYCAGRLAYLGTPLG